MNCSNYQAIRLRCVPQLATIRWWEDSSSARANYLKFIFFLVAKNRNKRWKKNCRLFSLYLRKPSSVMLMRVQRVCVYDAADRGTIATFCVSVSFSIRRTIKMPFGDTFIYCGQTNGVHVCLCFCARSHTQSLRPEKSASNTQLNLFQCPKLKYGSIGQKSRSSYAMCIVNTEQCVRPAPKMGGKQKRWTKSAKLCQFIGVSVNFYSSHFIICALFSASVFGGSGAAAVSTFFCVLLSVRIRQKLSAWKSAHIAFDEGCSGKKATRFSLWNEESSAFKCFAEGEKKYMIKHNAHTTHLYISSVAVNKMSKWEMNGQSCWPKSNFAPIKYFCDEVNIFAWHEIARKWQPK